MAEEKTNANTLFKSEFKKILGDRKSGWSGEDSEKLASALIHALKKKADGSSGKFTPELNKLVAASVATDPTRIVAFLKKGLTNAGIIIDDITDDYLRQVLNAVTFRTELVKSAVLEKGSKGKKRKSVATLLAE